MIRLCVMMKSQRTAILLLLVALQVVACSDSSDSPSGSQVPVVDPNDNIPPPTTQDIANTLLIRSDYSILLLLIERAGLTELLQTDNNGQGWTLFAPSDVAFAAGEDVSQLTTEASAELVQLHLHSGTLSSSNMQVGPLTMSAGTVEVQFTDTGIIVGGATIVGRDRVVGNGVIHFVDSVLESSVN